MATNFNESLTQGCPAPFYNAESWPTAGGSIADRQCLPEALTSGKTCCLPCPVTQWIYGQSFQTTSDAAAWVNVASLVLLTSLLLSYALLPAHSTRAHYLNTCLVISTALINLGFVVPFGAKPNACYNPITPADMYSSTTCAFSGAFILAGALTAVMWVFVRALSMHLQICWDISPGRKFFYWVQAAGWSIPAALFTAAITTTGVSFRFGPGACHVRHTNSRADFWGWLLALAGLSIFLQVATFLVCFHIYLRSLWADDDTEQSTQASVNPAPTYTSSLRKQTARAIYNRLKRVVWLQWRGLVMVSIVLVNVVFFAVTFIILDNRTVMNQRNGQRAIPWLKCILLNPEKPELCYDYGQRWLISEANVGAVLVLLPLNGFILFGLMIRSSFFGGWKDFFANLFGKKQEFVSFNAAQHEQYGRQPVPRAPVTETKGAEGAQFEMQQPSKEYAVDEHASESTDVSPMHTPVEKHYPAMQYRYARRTPDPMQEQGYFTSPQGTPAQPQGAWTQPNPNRVRSPSLNGTVSNASYGSHGTYGRSSPQVHQQAPNQSFARAYSFSRPRRPSHNSAVAAYNAFSDYASTPTATAPTMEYPRPPARAHRSQDTEQAGLAMCYDNSKPGHVVYR